MSYQVLARRWRPRNFSQMVGQLHALKPLINALDHDRLHHAFLFTGTRGVGKTTLARILAKSINCEEGLSSTPCGKCNSCLEIDEGRFVDLIEVDAASRTKVDDTRELLDNVQYVPTRGRYKVYLIDEVHMLSKHSFNALLKTLEEPPPHVKFIFATTDPQKLPATILSRCLQFNLKQLTVEEIQGHLAHILTEEQVVYSEEALWEIALAAHGSMRDALSLLDQAVSYGNGELRNDEVREMLGTIDRTRIVQLLHSLISGDGVAMLDEIEQIGQLGGDYNNALNGINHALQQIAIYQVIPDSSHERFGEAEQLRELAAQVDRETIQLYYQIGINGLRDLPLAPDLRSGFEMVMLRMLAFQPQISASQSVPSTPAAGRPSVVEKKSVEPAESAQSAQQITKAQNSVAEAAVAVPQTEQPPEQTIIETPAVEPAPEAEYNIPSQLEDVVETLQQPTVQPNDVVATPAMPVETPAASVASEMFAEIQSASGNAELDQQWLTWVNTLPLTAMVRQLAENCVLIYADSETIRLHLVESCAHLRHEQREQVLSDALSNFLERRIGLEIEVAATTQQSPAELKKLEAAERQAQAESAIADDPLVHSLQEQFGATVIPNTVKPL
ncbi:MAG: DNA polymerase III subunit gamma/tau [Gammaproteobacteria bacterium]|nr:DNA polymerase III subunit gamma/tau [Gammaproteobacteria bacterium]